MDIVLFNCYKKPLEASVFAHWIRGYFFAKEGEL